MPLPQTGIFALGNPRRVVGAGRGTAISGGCRWVHGAGGGAIEMIAALSEVAGTENPSLSVAPRKLLVPSDSPGAGGSVLLLQKCAHASAAWSRLPVDEQEPSLDELAAFTTIEK